MGAESSISVCNDSWLPTTRPKPANKNQHNSLINTTARTWNTHIIWALADPHDAKNIESIPLDRS